MRLLPRAPLRTLLLPILVGPPLLQAHEPGTLSGRIRDIGGRPMPGALVEVAGPAVGPPLRTTADATGSFTLKGVPKGTFLVSVRAPGYFTYQRRISTETGHAVALEVTLHLYSASVEVTAQAGIAHLADLDAPVNHLLGIADTASQGIVTPAKLDQRAYLRTGEILETVPGLLISQHSGEGKANQYYLRGFNLDHGTDVGTTVAGLPVNMRTHAHGQGYSDLNFLIPELVSNIQYEKGPYFADEGDFSAAGAVHINYVHSLDRPFAQLDLGRDAYRRLLTAGSLKLAGGHLLGAVEGFHNDGPWVTGDDFRKFNGLIRYSWVGPRDSLELTGMAYHGRWNSTDQIPARAVASGQYSRFGSIDPTDGGWSRRNSLVASWTHAGEDTHAKVQAYFSDYAMDLFSNFTYFLNDPVNGDQFQQRDRRTLAGLKARQRWSGFLLGHLTDTEVGLEIRNDTIRSLGIFNTRARQILATSTLASVLELSEGFWIQNKVQWSPTIRSILGLREDLYQFEVRSNLPANAGQAHATLTSPKASLVFGPFSDTEFYVSYGQGFHSNDARGTTIRVDPATGDPVERVTPLVRALGYEVGLRTAILPAWQSTLALWRLDLGSELVFAGDSGTTEASRPTRRLGVEWSNEIHLSDHLTLNADLAYSRARFADRNPAGDHVPESIEGVGLVGISWKATDRLDFSVLQRYFGPRALREDNGVRSQASHLTQGQARWRPTPNLTLTADLFNVFNRRATDIDYFYTSRLPGEAAEGVEDLHSHPVEPRQFRLGLQVRY